MGKLKNKRTSGVKPSRNVPLAEQLLEEKSVRPPGREKQRRRREDDDDVGNTLSLIAIHLRSDRGTLVIVIKSTRE